MQPCSRWRLLCASGGLAAPQEQTMAKNWYVVASAARARVLELVDDRRPADRTQPVFVHVADLVHPQSRLKGSELGDDRPGHGVASGHGGGTAYPPRTDAHDRERDRFAQLQHDLDRHRHRDLDRDRDAQRNGFNDRDRFDDRIADGHRDGHREPDRHREHDPQRDAQL